MKECPTCGNDISDAAVTCEHCGSTIPLPRAVATLKPPPKAPLGTGVIVFIAMVLSLTGGFIVVGITCDEKPPKMRTSNLTKKTHSPTREADFPVKHLPLNSGVQLSAEAFYNDLRLRIDGRISRDGNTITVMTSSCEKLEPVVEGILPNHVEVDCMNDDGTHAYWALDRN